AASTHRTESPTSAATSGLSAESTTFHSRPTSTPSVTVPDSSPVSDLTTESTTFHSIPSSLHRIVSPGSSPTSGLTTESTTFHSIPSSLHRAVSPGSSPVSGLTTESTTFHSIPSSLHRIESSGSSATSGLTRESTTFHSIPSSLHTTVSPGSSPTSGLPSQSSISHSIPSSLHTTVSTGSSQASGLLSQSSTSTASPASSTTPAFPPASSTTSGLTTDLSTIHSDPASTPSLVSIVSLFSTMSPEQCQDGKVWNGIQCVCPQGYFGHQCLTPLEYFHIEVPGKINATLGVIVKVTYRIFTEDLNNTASQAYLNFVELFKKEMDKVYSGNDLPQYGGVIIKELLKGSIVVKYDILLEMNYTAEYWERFADLTEIVTAKTRNETKKFPEDPALCYDSILCYSEVATFVDKTVKLGFDFQEQCTQKAAKEFAQFYYVDILDGQQACVTKCTQGTKSQLDCHGGMCQLQRSGPRCLCPNVNTHWYWGETCEFSISKSLVYGVVGTVVAVLLIALVVLIVLLGLSQRKLHRGKCDVSPEWKQEDVAGTFRNTGIWEENNLKEDRYGLENTYSQFRPSLGHVDPTTELHIQRPNVVTPTP
uniref:SEA domain-containing protein n=1 Tax=Otolemur garnettii TaxID=30611 RepID=H0WN57_OTOGA